MLVTSRQQYFARSEVAVDWHELTDITRPSVARTNGQLDSRCSISHTTAMSFAVYAPLVILGAWAA